MSFDKYFFIAEPMFNSNQPTQSQYQLQLKFIFLTLILKNNKTIRVHLRTLCDL